MRALRVSVCVVACVVITGCVTDGQQPNLLPTDQEIELGEQFGQQIESEEQVLQNAAVQAYVRGIGDRLAALSPRTDVKYRFTVIDNPDTVNAFALPGGRMYIYTGLMKLCENEGELASVMAHEIAHVAEHHHGEAMTRQYGMEVVAGLLLGEDPQLWAQVMAQFGGTGFSLMFSRQNEREADRVGMTILAQAGYAPSTMLGFMDKMLQEQNRTGGYQPLPIFSSHPATEARLSYLGEMAAQLPPSLRQGDGLFAGRYQTNVLTPLGVSP